MSKNSSIQNYTQLTEWLSTLKTKRNKPVNSNSSQTNYSKADAYNQRK